MATNEDGEAFIDDFEIQKILANDQLFSKNWLLFCHHLGFEQSIKSDLERMVNHNCSTTDLVTHIMANWKSISPNANIKILCDKLRDISCNNCADKIEALNLSETSCKFTSTNRIWLNVRSPTKYYYGRENELQLIDKQSQDAINNKEIHFVAITGLGGIGKSELAKNYAKYYYETSTGHCIWIDAETNHTLLHSIQNLAVQRLDISLTDDMGKEKILQALMQEVYVHLSDQRCLIILDNVETYENPFFSVLTEIASIQPPKAMKPFVIITSRMKPAKKYFGNKCTPIELDILSENAAVTFFLQAFGLIADQVDQKIKEGIESMCARLHYYPLAMQQAFAYINEKLPSNPESSHLQKEITNYEDVLQKEGKKLLDHKLPKYESLEGTTKTTYLTWRITIEQIVKLPGIGNVAVRLLEIISFLSSEDISTILVKQLYEKTQIGVDTSNISFLCIYRRLCDMLRRTKASDGKQKLPNFETCFQKLSDHSMISLTNDKVSIHRLVQEVIRIDLQETGQLEILLEKLLTTIQQILEVDFKTKLNSFSVDQMVHVENIWEHAAKNTQLIIRHKEFPYFVCLKFYSCGKYRDSYDFSCRALNCLESSLGGDNREILQIKFCKGRALKGMGDYQLSLELMTDAYNKQKEVFGEQDEDSLMTAIGVGSVFWRIKKFDEAMQWYKNALVQREKISGKLHPQTVELKNNVASVLDNQGKYTEAVALYQEILEDAEPVLGTEHPELLITKHNLAVVKFHEQKYQEALKIFQQVLQVRQRVLDANHPLTLITAHWIANTYKLLNRTAEAIELARQVLQQREKMLGPRHPDTLATNNLLISLEI